MRFNNLTFLKRELKMFLMFLILVCSYGYTLNAQDIFEPGDFKFETSQAVWVKLPEGVSFQSYPSDSLGFHKCILIDLDGDGISENLWVNMYGTGGCVYTIQRGKDQRYIGEFFGEPVIVRAKKINDMPVINSYSHASAGSGDYFCYVFNGEEYVIVSKIHLLKESVEYLFKKLKDIPTYQK